MDHVAPLLKDLLVAVANRTTAKWQKKTKKVERKKKQEKL